ncbi:hypothetical protein LDENG_00003430 [Lucifuga dentata]|nr:hypothetical protein LDENG_00003430 [Lucifuga dentata]
MSFVQLQALKDHTVHFACLSLICSIHTRNVTDNHFQKHTTNGELFFSIFQTTIDFSSFWYTIKINLLIVEMFLG